MPLRFTLHRLWHWLTFPGPLRLSHLPPPPPQLFFTTGPDLVGRLVRAIQLNQSVVLAGPRGCGKSRCVRDAIDKARELGLINHSVTLVGNRELPRDYLMEDDIGFRYAGSDTVLPEPRYAPLFQFVKRDGNTHRPDESNGKVECPKFVLFLDEINRFSDGVLDSLLSVLEERKAILAGKEYDLPVVVLMTMNPPGYDGSARKLSPPLAARIGRTYRLCTPDLDTLSDRLIASKIREMQKEMKDGPFPKVPVKLQRQAALATLCMWGDPTAGTPGMEYLTPGTLDLLQDIHRTNPVIRRAMRTLTQLCRYGPDGRAASDWIRAAVGLWLQESSSKDDPRPLGPRHLLATAVESIAHKLYDNFSAASQPAKTSEKEAAVLAIVRQILTLGTMDRYVLRVVDTKHHLNNAFAAVLSDVKDLDQAFRNAGVVADKDVEKWCKLARWVRESSPDLPPQYVSNQLERDGFIVKAEDLNSDEALPAGFVVRGDDTLARELAQRGGRLGKALETLLKNVDNQGIGPLRTPIESELAAFEGVQAIGVARFLEVVHETVTTRRDRHTLAQWANALWSQQPLDGPEVAAEQFVLSLEGERHKHSHLVEPFAELIDDLIRAAGHRKGEVLRLRRFYLAVKRQLQGLQS